MDKLYKNITDQVKEIQLKLGYAKETVRLFYQLSSLNNILGICEKNADSMLVYLQKYHENNMCEQDNRKFDDVSFITSGDRLEVIVPANVCEYIHNNVEDNPFLAELVELFKNKHNASIKEICSLFGKYDENYICMPHDESDDFDYVIYFSNTTIDEYYYCIKIEIGHTIYHRFTKEDYENL